MLNKKRNREPMVETWEEIKRVMQKRFVPTYYYRELYNKLQNPRQGNHSVEEYYKEMEVQWIEQILKKIERLQWRGFYRFKLGDSECGGIATLWGVGGYGAYGY